MQIGFNSLGLLERPGKRPRLIKDAETNKRALNGREDKTKKRTRQPPLSRVEEEEDAYIVYLEKKLGYGKGKKRMKKALLGEDGLDGKSIIYSRPLTDRFLDLEDWADSFAFPATVCSHGRYNVLKPLTQHRVIKVSMDKMLTLVPIVRSMTLHLEMRISMDKKRKIQEQGEKKMNGEASLII